MRIVEIVPVTKTKYRVVTDEQLAFMLYKGELSRYRLKENGELSAEIFQEIFREILVKRAKLRAMHLLTRMDYTEAELEKKLMKGEYTPQAVKIAMDYVRSYHYLDDERYVARYLSAYQGRKSRRQMQFELERKGIPREMIQRRQETMDDEEGNIFHRENKRCNCALRSQKTPCGILSVNSNMNGNYIYKKTGNPLTNL